MPKPDPALFQYRLNAMHSMFFDSQLSFVLTTPVANLDQFE